MAITIVTPPLTTDLTTLQEVKDLLSITDASSDAILGVFIDQASAAVKSYLGCPLGLQTIDETIAGNGRQEIMLSRPQISSITSIIFSGTVVDASSYTLQEPEAAIVFREDFWTFSGKDYKYTFRYVFGYSLPNDASPTLPLDIQYAADLLVVSMFNSKGADLSVESEKFPDVYEVVFGKSRGTNIVNKHFTPEVKGLLDPHVFRRL